MVISDHHFSLPLHSQLQGYKSGLVTHSWITPLRMVPFHPFAASPVFRGFPWIPLPFQVTTPSFAKPLFPESCDFIASWFFYSLLFFCLVLKHWSSLTPFSFCVPSLNNFIYSLPSIYLPNLCPLALASIQPFLTMLLGYLTSRVVGIIGKEKYSMKTYLLVLQKKINFKWALHHQSTEPLCW